MSRAEEPEVWNEAYVYVDEQLDGTSEAASFGALFVPSPLSLDVVRAALLTLPSVSGPGIRGAFHASEDGPDARRAFADAIGRRVPTALFRAMQYPVARAPGAPGASGDPAARSERRQHAAALAVGYALTIGKGTVHVELGASLGAEALVDWMEDQQDVRLRVMVRQRGSNPTRFPRVSVTSSDLLDSAGAQAADLLLWLDRGIRAPATRDRRQLRAWLELAGFEPDTEWDQASGPMRQRTYRKGAAARPIGSRPPGGADDPGPARSRDVRLRALTWIERTVHEIASAAAAPAHIEHLIPRVRAASRALRETPRSGPELLASFLEAFLVLADTLPVYTDEPASLRVAATAIAIAADLANPGDPRAREMLLDWARHRQVAP